MARPIRNTYSRKSRNAGYTSGVTIETRPSGVTMYKKTVKNDDGYALWHDTDSEMIKMGILACAGTSLARQNFGLSLIHHVVAVPAFNRAAVSAAAIAIVKPNTSAWASGVTEVDLYVFSTPQGAAFGTDVSIQYFAVGT